MVDETEKVIEDVVVEQGFKFGLKHAAFICATLGVCGPFIKAHEGDVLRSYRDIGGVTTACEGIAGVLPNHTYSRVECDKMDAEALQQKINGVVKLIHVPVTPTLVAAHSSFAYNIGLSAYKKSQTLKLTNAGRLKDGCRAMINWFTAGKRDCRVRSNNCYGVWTRRQDEEALCLKGVK